jgi:hypothetical protein
LVSDINSGLYIIADQTLENNTGKIAFEPNKIPVDEGQTASIVVTKNGNGATSVSYEVVLGSADLEDVILTNGELHWTTNDTQSQNITLQTTNDSLDEITESVFIRLFDPKNGATLLSPSITTVQIFDALQQGQIVFATDQITVKETDGTLKIAVTRQGGTDGNVSVQYVISSGTAIVGTDADTTSGTLEWLDGDSTDQYIDISLIDDNETEAQESLVLTLTAIESNVLGNQSTLIIMIRDDESNQAPTATAGDNSEVNTRQSVTLTGSGIDPEDQPLYYLWQQLSGTNVTINNADTAQASFAAPSAATTLEFSLTITDDFGLTSTDIIVITVIAPITNTNTPSNSSGGGSAFGLILLSLLWLRLRRNTVEKISKQTQYPNK